MAGIKSSLTIMHRRQQVETSKQHTNPNVSNGPRPDKRPRPISTRVDGLPTTPFFLNILKDESSDR
jgi:hypothetical protein